MQLDLEAHRGKVTEWLQNQPVQGEIRRQFKKFLRTFKDDNGDRLYARVIENMVLGEWVLVQLGPTSSTPWATSAPCPKGRRGQRRVSRKRMQ